MSLPPKCRQQLKEARLRGDLAGGLQLLTDELAHEHDSALRHARFWQGLADMHAVAYAEEYFNMLAHPTKSDAIAYAKFLWLMGHIVKADVVMPHDAALGEKASTLSHHIKEKAAQLSAAGISKLSDVPAALYARARARTSLSPGFGTLFYTGQLGPGGAEKQFSNIACKLKGNQTPPWPVAVAIKHADPTRNANFHVPKLRQAKIDLSVLDEMPTPQMRVDDPAVLELVSLLPDPISAPVAKLCAVLKRVKPESVYLWQDGGVLIGALAAALSGVPRIVTSFRGLPPNLRPKLFRAEYEPLYRAMCTDASVTFTSNTAATAKKYSERLESTEDQFQVLRNAVVSPDPTPLHEDEVKYENILRATPECTHTILGVFRSDPVKQPKLWLEAAIQATQKHKTVRVIHIGDGDISGELNDQIKNSPLKDRVIFAGLTQRVGFWMSKADILLHLALQEGSPNVIIEAQLSGLPVIATPAGGTVEAVTHRETGILLPSTTPDLTSIGTEIDSLLSEPKLRAALAKRAKEQASHLHDPHRILHETQALLCAPAPRRAA